MLRPLHIPLGNASFSEHTRTCPEFLIQHLKEVAGTATALGNSSISQASLWTHVEDIHILDICTQNGMTELCLWSEQNGNHAGTLVWQGAWTLSLHY